MDINVYAFTVDTDDLMWFGFLDSTGAWNVTGPKSSSFDDSDIFTHWAPCEPPRAPELE